MIRMVVGAAAASGRHYVMHRLGIAILIVVASSGCSTDAPKQTTRFVTEQDARIISIARSAATAEGFSLADAIYQVRRDGDGWIVNVGMAPGYDGVGEPAVVIDGGFTVKIGVDEQVREILGYGWIKSTTRPNGGA